MPPLAARAPPFAACRPFAARAPPFAASRAALCSPHAAFSSPRAAPTARSPPLQPARRPFAARSPPLQPARHPPLAPPYLRHPAAMHAPPCLCRPAAAAAARATAVAGGGSAGSAGSAAGARGAGRAPGSAGGAAGAGGAGPTTDRLCLSSPLSRQLQRLGVDSGGHCLSRTTSPLSSFASGFFSELVQVVEALVSTYYTEAAAKSVGDLLPPGASESTAALGASESAATLGDKIGA
ncbi:unnamed protein product [Closterium sp. NIES-54]